ncbi:hypothetical protein JCM10213_005235 [Rhodosporidiobolus nylandii]
MGKRKSSKKPQSRVKLTLDKSFRCVFCAHQGSVTCKMDNKLHVGRLDCKDCGQTFTMDINHLSEPVDVYSAWIDACEEANPAAAPAPRARASASGSTSASKSKGSSSGKKRRTVGSDDEDEEEDEPAAGTDEDEDDLPDVRRPKRRKAASPVAEEEEEDAEGEDDD